MNKTLDPQRLKSLTSIPTKRTAKLPNIRLHHSQKVPHNLAVIPPNLITLRPASLSLSKQIKKDLLNLLLRLKQLMELQHNPQIQIFKSITLNLLQLIQTNVPIRVIRMEIKRLSINVSTCASLNVSQIRIAHFHQFLNTFQDKKYHVVQTKAFIKSSFVERKINLLNASLNVR